MNFSSFLTLMVILLLPCTAKAGLYLGGQYGTSALSHKGLKEYDVLAKGPAYGGFLGINHEFLGLEGFYTKFATEAKILHEGSEYSFMDDTTAAGMALRISTSFFNVRAGLAQFNIRHTTDAELPESDEIDQLYRLQNDTKKMGSVFGVGMHLKVFDSTRLMVDFSHYAINGVGYYQTVSVGLAFVMKGDLNLFSFSKDGM